MEDLYATLGVGRSASIDEIKKVYRKKARELHPDVNPGNAAAEERFKKVSAAFDVLSNPEKKKLYDEFGADGLRPGFDPEQARAFKRQWRGHGSGGFRTGFGGFGDIFGDDVGGFDFGDLFGGRADPTPRRGGDVHATITIDLRDAVLGVEREISFQKPDGSNKRLKIKIPAGTDDGGTLRLGGQGMPGPAGAGDLLLEISVRPHPSVRRDGRDLSMDVPVTVKEAMVGGPIDVPTFHGSIKLTVPPGSQSGDRLRVKGRGIGGGDLFVVLQICVPTSGGQEAAEELERAYRGDVRASLRL